MKIYYADEAQKMHSIELLIKMCPVFSWMIFITISQLIIIHILWGVYKKYWIDYIRKKENRYVTWVNLSTKNISRKCYIFFRDL